MYIYGCKDALQWQYLVHTQLLISIYPLPNFVSLSFPYLSLSLSLTNSPTQPPTHLHPTLLSWWVACFTLQKIGQFSVRNWWCTQSNASVRSCCGLIQHNTKLCLSYNKFVHCHVVFMIVTHCKLQINSPESFRYYHSDSE